MHIVDELILERAPRLVNKPRLFKHIKPWLYRLLDYNKAVSVVDTIMPMTGRDAFDHITQRVNPDIRITGAENIPASGRCVIIANHPTGLADGMAVFKALAPRRPEHIYLANADALRVIPKGEDIIIPVEWVKDKRTHQKARQTLISTKKAIQNNTCVVIFPSGVLGKLTWRGIKDKPWQNSAAMLAKKY
ncbi:MAG: 1-acyl-sn-glycerol-3-phosphate acyltransferase, partial [Litorimonas sp.]